MRLQDEQFSYFESQLDIHNLVSMQTNFALLLRLFFGLFYNDLAQSVNGRVVNVLHLVHCDDGHHGPIEADGVGLVPRQHVELDCLVTLELESVGPSYLILWRDLSNDFPYRSQAINGPAKVKRVVPVEFRFAAPEFQESQFKLLLERLWNLACSVALDVST